MTEQLAVESKIDALRRELETADVDTLSEVARFIQEKTGKPISTDDAPTTNAVVEFLNKSRDNLGEPTFSKCAVEDIADKARRIIVRELVKLGADQDQQDLFDQFATLYYYLSCYKEQIPGWIDQETINTMGTISYLIDALGYSIFEQY